MLLSATLALPAGGLLAQGATGKVQGTVLDPTGQPLANAQVFLIGTSFSAFTSAHGFYFMNNVPAGVYDMRAQFIGYQPAQMDGVLGEVGDTAQALRVYEHYLKLRPERPDYEPWAATWDSVRAEYAALGGR